MSEAVVHIESVEEREGMKPSRARTRSCVGCGERVDLLLLGQEAGDLVRLVFGPDGSVGVDVHNGTLSQPGRGAHVHARPACVERAVKGGLSRSAKGRIATLVNEESSEPLSAEGLARAIQRSMARRVEGFVAAAVRSRQIVHGAEAVTGACQRGEAELVVVACDVGIERLERAESSVADLTEVRRAVAEGRAVAWGSEQLLGQMITGKLRASVPANGSEGEAPPVAVVVVPVMAITSRHIAVALRQSVQIADACSAIVAGSTPKGGGRAPGGQRSGARGRSGGYAGQAAGSGCVPQRIGPRKESSQRRLSGVRSNVERGA